VLVETVIEIWDDRRQRDVEVAVAGDVFVDPKHDGEVLIVLGRAFCCGNPIELTMDEEDDAKDALWCAYNQEDRP
jgi:hypothetical protein